MGRKIVDSKEELDAGAEDDDVDNVGESEGDEFEQETGWCIPRYAVPFVHPLDSLHNF